ncbi:DUF6270 domain-containing protein [Achromobacter deleyi]|uniref:DUF6270 domain-containing protein n=1 Tax=Achromobacter deleyi TaxID=1353891 RepID=UPI00286ABDE9|nr:DUF6270 domain-containing protein [Achromobacter deleyi]
MQVCIFGSCVSRDIFNLAPPGEFDISLYVARSSIASIFSPPPFEDVYSAKLKSPFQRKLVSWDIEKKAVSLLRANSADVFLFDNIDDRFSLLVMPNGRRCTISSEMKSTGASSHEGAKIVRSGSPRFMQWWEHGWQQLVKTFSERGLLDRVLVNRVFCQPETESGKQFDRDQVDRINDGLSKMYEIQSKDLPSSQFIDYGAQLTCADDHQWGPSPFHFSQSSQRFALDQIRTIVSARKPSTAVQA